MKKITSLLIMLCLVVSVNAQTKRKTTTRKATTTKTTQTVSNAVPVTMPTTQQELIDMLVGKWEITDKVQGKSLKSVVTFDKNGNYKMSSQIYSWDKHGSINFDVITEGEFVIRSETRFTIFPNVGASEIKYVSSKGWSKADIADFKQLSPSDLGLDPSVIKYMFKSISNNIITVDQTNLDAGETSEVTFKKLQ